MTDKTLQSARKCRAHADAMRAQSADAWAAAFDEAADALDAQAERIKALEVIERYAMILTIAATDASSHDDWGWREIQSALVEALAEQPADFEDKARALLGEK